MKLALFKSVEYGTIHPWDKKIEGDETWIRTSEYVHVDFPPLPTGDVTAKEVSLLRETKKKIQAETEIKLNNVDRKIGELLALPNIK